MLFQKNKGAHPLGLAGFRFVPEPSPSECAAFSIAFKLLALAMLLGCAWWMTRLWMAGQFQLGDRPQQWMVWQLAALAMMAWFVASIWRSQTTVSAQELRQTWVWDKHTDLRDLAYAKLIRVRGLDWLIAPRLYVRTIDAKFSVYYASDAAVIAQMERLVVELRTHVTPRIDPAV